MNSLRDLAARLLLSISVRSLKNGERSHQEPGNGRHLVPVVIQHADRPGMAGSRTGSGPRTSAGSAPGPMSRNKTIAMLSSPSSGLFDQRLLDSRPPVLPVIDHELRRHRDDQCADPLRRTAFSVEGLELHAPHRSTPSVPRTHNSAGCPPM